MRRTRQLSFTLPNELAEAVKANVATGEYATESEVIRDGLRTLMARSSHRELAKGRVAAYDALRKRPSRARTPDQVRARLGAERKKSRRKHLPKLRSSNTSAIIEHCEKLTS